MNRFLRICLVAAVVLVPHGCADTQDTTHGNDAATEALTGEYLGQTPPGNEPALFAPGFISTGLYERDVAMTPDGDEFYFGLISGATVTIAMSRRSGGEWSLPEILPAFSDPDIYNLEPHITPDGSRMLFLSTRPRVNQPKRSGWEYQDIWVMDRKDGDWGVPYNLGPPVCTDAPEYFPSTTNDGTLYFTRSLTDGGRRRSLIFRSRLADSAYAEPELLPLEVNPGDNQFNACVDPAERFLILGIAGLPDNIGRYDYYVVFRNDDDTWTGPVNMGEKINTPGNSVISPSLSPDGRYFFFASNRTAGGEERPPLDYQTIQNQATRPENGNADIYWIDASFIESLRPASAQPGE